MVNGKPLDNKPKVTNTNTDTDENAKGPDGSLLPDESLSSKEKSKDKSLSTDIKTDNVQSAEVLGEFVIYDICSIAALIIVW